MSSTGGCGRVRQQVPCRHGQSASSYDHVGGADAVPYIPRNSRSAQQLGKLAHTPQARNGAGVQLLKTNASEVEPRMLA
jgi:hypothetical protein